mmetsp:Transcript_54973/g.146778  ORF Transcript_54973/g.146778 Transcript_54973/m.146778 type:complete len:236 (-) Transcript_54973:25-732(-)
MLLSSSIENARIIPCSTLWCISHRVDRFGLRLWPVRILEIDISWLTTLPIPTVALWKPCPPTTSRSGLFPKATSPTDAGRFVYSGSTSSPSSVWSLRLITAPLGLVILATAKSFFSLTFPDATRSRSQLMARWSLSQSSCTSLIRSRLQAIRSEISSRILSIFDSNSPVWSDLVWQSATCASHLENRSCIVPLWRSRSSIKSCILACSVAVSSACSFNFTRLTLSASILCTTTST